MNTDQPKDIGGPASAGAGATALSPEHDIEENKDIAAFSYLWVMSVFVYFLKKDSPFIRFHSKQAMILFGLSVVIWLIPISIIARPLELVILAGMVIGFLNAAQGKKKDVPIVGPLSRREITVRQAWHEVTRYAILIYKRIRKFFRRAEKIAKHVEEEHAAPHPTVPPVTTTPPTNPPDSSSPRI